MYPDRYIVLYDGQCEVCQACVSWLMALDRKQKTECIPLEDVDLDKLHPDLKEEACLRELHVVSPEKNIYVGWDAVAKLALLFPVTWIIGAVGVIPICHWLGVHGYRMIARNRYLISKCRGGKCRVSFEKKTEGKSGMVPFWTCYTTGFLTKIPLVIWSSVMQARNRLLIFLSVRRKQIELFDGKLSIFFLGGFFPDLASLMFGEQFTMIVYDGIAIDPGSPKMRNVLLQHLSKIDNERIIAIVGTHHHEEHIGNLNWLSQITKAPIYVNERTAAILHSPLELPWARSLMIGQPPPLEKPYEVLGTEISGKIGALNVIATPGHCEDQIALYDANERLLIAGDAFMGSYFSTPNPDVDSRIWIETLQRLLELDIDTLVEGHGHIHTVDPRIPDIVGVVNRQSPKVLLKDKLRFMEWIREQVEAGVREGLTADVVEASCFPWVKRISWENFINDQAIRLLSKGHFSRRELVRSFFRDRKTRKIFPETYMMNFWKKKQ